MRFPLPAGGALLATALAAPFVLADQPLELVIPEQQQQIEVLHAQGAQMVDEVILQPEQQVVPPEPVTPGMRAASTAGKVILGITAAAIAIGGAVASLLFL